MKHLLTILASLVMVLSFTLIPATALADNSLSLVSKDPTTWTTIPGASGTLTYNSSGPTFNFSFTATGLEATTPYSLIYYANPWPGNNPGKLLGSSTAVGGNLTITGSPDLGINLPTVPDSNMVVNHCVPPDNYAHCYGAKIWLVPTTCYTGTSITTWSPTRFLFETDLITYTDTDLVGTGTGVPLTTTITEPAATIGLSVTPISLNFGSVNVGTCSSEQVITLTNTGNVPIKVTASTSAGYYTDCLKLNNLVANGWISATIPVSSFIIVNAKSCPTISYSGVVSGTVTFVASFAP